MRLRALAGRLAWLGTAGYAADRLLKLLAFWRLRQCPAPLDPTPWPPVVMLHPISRPMGAVNPLAANLAACARLDYPAPRQHLLLCDAADTLSLACCQEFCAAHPTIDARIVTVPAGRSPVAPKIVKLLAGLATVTPPTPAAVLCLIDDDIAPRPAALRALVAALGPPTSNIAATFGLPCYTNWRTVWSTLLSSLNNANFPPTSALLTYLGRPPRITGHLTAYRWRAFTAAGGLDGLANQIDDDFALARRLYAHGFRLLQTAVLYDVDNDLPTADRLTRQLRRWFVLPRQAMAGGLTRREAANGIAVSLGLLAPPLVALLALLSWSPRGAAALLATIASAAGANAASERLLRHPAPLPLRRWWTLPATTLVLPLGTLAAALFANNEVEWRGQRLRIAPGGQFEQLP